VTDKMRSVVPLLSLLLTLYGVGSIKIEPCCPIGQIRTKEGCKFYDGEIPPFIAQWTGGEDREVDFFSGKEDKFSCEGDLVRVSTALVYGDVLTKINSTTGWLQITDLNGTELDSYSNTNFCGYYTDLYSSDGALEPKYVVCYNLNPGQTETEKKFKDIFYPAALLVSAVFILVTIIFHCTVGSLRKTLFAKITLGFLVNAFICYLFLSISRYHDTSPDKDESILGTMKCKIFGYIAHHTFIAFFFWMTAMAFNITKSISTMQVVRNQKSSLKSFLVYFLYAQGIPVLISITVLLLDTFQPNIPLPNMGNFSCFVGQEFDLDTSFFANSTFLYYYLIMIVLISFNIICFLVTSIYLCNHWQSMKTVQTSCSDGLVDHFSIIVKLSVIMGVPWVLDIVSAYLEYTYGSKVFTLMIILDILNLLTGILIFLSLICKPSVWTQIKNSYTKKIDKTNLHLTKSSNSTSTTASVKNASLNETAPIRSV